MHSGIVMLAHDLGLLIVITVCFLQFWPILVKKKLICGQSDLGDHVLIVYIKYKISHQSMI